MTKSRKVPDIPISHAPTLRGQEWPVAGVLDSTGLQNQELRVITGPSCSAGRGPCSLRPSTDSSDRNACPHLTLNMWHLFVAGPEKACYSLWLPGRNNDLHEEQLVKDQNRCLCLGR